MDDENTPPENAGPPATPEPPATPAAPDAPAAPVTDAAAAATTTSAVTTKTNKKRGPIVIAVVVAVVVLLAAGAAAFVLNSLAGTGDVLVSKVPENAFVYATVYLDPAAHQKMNLEALVKKFPALQSGDASQTLSKGLDSMLSGSGLTYETDIKPWLGSQVGVVVTSKGDNPGAAILIASTDDTAASAALKKLQSGPDNGNLKWVSQDYKGTQIWIGNSTFAPIPSATSTLPAVGIVKPQTDTLVGGPQSAYAVVDGTVVIAGGPDPVKSVIDTADGDAPNLGASSDYQNTIKTLPSERLALGYVNVKSAFDMLGPLGQSGLGSSLPDQGALATLKAFSGVGESISAESDGLSIKISAPVDVSKLPAAQQAMFNTTPHENSVLAWTPENAYGTLNVTTLGQQLKTLLDQAKAANPAFSSSDQLLGISSAIDSLTGDAGLEVTPGTGQFPTGALLLGTKDTANTQAFLDKISQLAMSGIGGTSGSTATGALATEDYNGVTITEIPIPAAQSAGVEPAYAVTDGMAIIGASPDAVKAAIDAHKSGSSITNSQTFQTALSHVNSSNSQMFYADVQAIIEGVKTAIPSDESGMFSALVAPNLAPIKSVILTSTSDSNGQSAEMFIVIQ